MTLGDPLRQPTRIARETLQGEQALARYALCNKSLCYLSPGNLDGDFAPHTLESAFVSKYSLVRCAHSMAMNDHDKDNRDSLRGTERFEQAHRIMTFLVDHRSVEQKNL